MTKRLLLVLLCSAALYGANIWGTSIYILDEAKNSGCAMEMYDRGDWIVPTFNNELRTDKPPLHYYFMRLGYSLTGITPFAARLFSVVMGVALIYLLFAFVKKHINELAAFWTAMITSLSIQLAIQFHLAVPDPYLIFFLTLGLLSFYDGYVTGRGSRFRLAYFAISLAVLAKGPVAIVFSGLTALIFLITQEKFSLSLLGRIRLIQGIFIFAITVLPWYALVGLATGGEWLRGFFLEHNMSRFTNTMEGHGGFPLASLVIAFAALLPFSFYGPQAMATVWKRRKENTLLTFALIAASVVVVFFAFSRTILPSYPEPAVPFLAILIGYYFSVLLSTSELPKRWMISAGIYCLIALCLPVAAYAALDQDTTLKPVAHHTIYFVLLPAGAIAAMVFLFRKQLQHALISYSISSFVFLIVFFYWIFPQVDRLNPVRVSLSKMNTAQDVYFHKDFNPAFVFGLARTLPAWSPEEDVLKPYYIITQKRYTSDFDSLHTTVIYEGQDLFEKQVTLVLEVK